MYKYSFFHDAQEKNIRANWLSLLAQALEVPERFFISPERKKINSQRREGKWRCASRQEEGQHTHASCSLEIETSKTSHGPWEDWSLTGVYCSVIFFIKLLVCLASERDIMLSKDKCPFVLDKFESRERCYVPTTARWVFWWGGIDVSWGRVRNQTF